MQQRWKRRQWTETVLGNVIKTARSCAWSVNWLRYLHSLRIDIIHWCGSVQTTIPRSTLVSIATIKQITSPLLPVIYFPRNNLFNWRMRQLVMQRDTLMLTTWCDVGRIARYQRGVPCQKSIRQLSNDCVSMRGVPNRCYAAQSGDVVCSCYDWTKIEHKSSLNEWKMRLLTSVDVCVVLHFTKLNNKNSLKTVELNKFEKWLWA